MAILGHDYFMRKPCLLCTNEVKVIGVSILKLYKKISEVSVMENLMVVTLLI